MPDSRWRSWLLDAVLLYAITAYLIWPLFRIEYMDAWASIDATFISDGRFLRDNGRPAWQPNWYAGTRTDYVYPPMLRYATAAISKWAGVTTFRSYHLYTALSYCLGTVAVYLLVRSGFGRRGWALIAGAASTLVSPGFLFLAHFRGDYEAVRYMPLRLGVLVRYGEGPHMSSYAWVFIALAAAWWGVRKGRPALLALSAVASALCVSNNFYGATALAMSFPILAWCVFLAERDHRVWLRSMAIAALAYGLTASWLTPSFLRITLRNMRLVSQPGNTWSVYAALGLIALFAAISFKLGWGKPRSAWGIFTAGLFSVFTLDVLGQYYFNFRVIGEPERLVPEFELTFILASILVLAWLWTKRLLGKAAVLVLLWISILPFKGWVRRSWEFIPEYSGYQERLEYKMTKWIHDNIPGTRVMATGSLRFWYNAWFDLPQLGGGSEQGTLNLNTSSAYFQIVGHDSNEVAIAWLQAMGAGAVAVHDQTSEEIYRDFPNPHRFRNVLKPIYEDGRGNWIYEVPRRYPALARAVDTAAMRAIPPQAEPIHFDHIRAYIALIENGPGVEPHLLRRSADQFHVRIQLDQGQLLLVQETYDPAWRAWSNGRPVPVTADPIGFMLVDPGPGSHEILMRFETPLENQVGRGLTAASFIGAIALALASRRRFL